jgi:hypothetical protein
MVIENGVLHSLPLHIFSVLDSIVLFKKEDEACTTYLPENHGTTRDQTSGTIWTF